MSNIHIYRPHPFSQATAHARIDGLRQPLADKLGIRSAWQGEQLNLNGRGVKGTITVTADDIDIKLKLGLLMSALAPTLEEKIAKGLDDAIAKP